jgi:predicted metalloprotease with PDZ domain
MSILGDSSCHIGDYAFLYFFGAKAPNGALITTIESHGTFEVAHVKDDRHFAHEMYHAWWGDGHFLPDAWRFIRVPGWFLEGTNEYLGVKAHLATGAFTSDMANNWHNQFYNEYKSIAGSPNDMPLIQCQESLPFRSSAWNICLYSKSHTVLFLLDQTLGKLTDQKIWIENLYKYFLEKYSSNPVKVISENEILLATNQISGYDFKPFFDAYVIGNEILPIKIKNGQLEVEFDKLPELKKQ